MPKLVLEVAKEDAEEIEALQFNYPDDIDVVPLHSIEGSEWLSFAIEMTKALSPHVFALLTVLVTTRKKIVVIHNGKRKELTEDELKKLKDEHADGQDSS